MSRRGPSYAMCRISWVQLAPASRLVLAPSRAVYCSVFEFFCLFAGLTIVTIFELAGFDDFFTYFVLFFHVKGTTRP